MSRRERTRRKAAVFVTAVVIGVPTGVGLATTEVATAVTVAESTPPTTIPPPTTAETTEPDTSDSGMSDSGTTGGDDADALTWIAVLSALALMGVAVWWMTRSTGGDRPQQKMDDDWPDQSHVV